MISNPIPSSFFGPGYSEAGSAGTTNHQIILNTGELVRTYATTIRTVPAGLEVADEA